MTKEKFEGDALVVTHLPNPSDMNTSEFFPEPVFPYTWYYRTEVKNNSDRDLKVIWFEGYQEDNEYWYGSNILNRTLRNDVFLRWYGKEKVVRAMGSGLGNLISLVKIKLSSPDPTPCCSPRYA